MIGKKRNRLISACLFFAAILSACSFKSEKQVQKEDGSKQSSEQVSGQDSEPGSLENAGEEQAQQNGFTEEELSAEYLEKDVSGYFEIKGAVTPKSVYEDGVGIYRVKIYSGSPDAEERMTVPIKRAASAFPDIEPDWEKLEEDGSTWAELPFHETGGKRTGMISSGPEFLQFLYGNFDDVVPYKNCAIMWRNHVPYREKEDLPFLGMEEAAGKVMDVIKALTDAKVSESYIGQSYPETPVEIINEYYEISEDEQDHFAGSFYYFLFYFSKDGIKMDNLISDFPKEDGVSYPKTVYIDEERNAVGIRGDDPIQVIYMEDGLIYLNLSELVEPLELYETVQVLSLEEMAEKLDGYFASQLGMPKTTVTSMELRYNTELSEPDRNGKVVEIMRPYWVAEYYDKRSPGKNTGFKYNGARKAVFDARTGEYITLCTVI